MRFTHCLRRNDVVLFTLVEPCHTLDGNVIRLSRSACEYDFSRIGTNQIRYLLQVKNMSDVMMFTGYLRR